MAHFVFKNETKNETTCSFMWFSNHTQIEAMCNINYLDTAGTFHGLKCCSLVRYKCHKLVHYQNIAKLLTCPCTYGLSFSKVSTSSLGIQQFN